MGTRARACAGGMSGNSRPQARHGRALRAAAVVDRGYARRGARRAASRDARQRPRDGKARRGLRGLSAARPGARASRGLRARHHRCRRSSVWRIPDRKRYGLVIGEAVFAGAVARIGGTRDTRERADIFGEVFRAAARLGLLVSLAYVILGSMATITLLGEWGGGQSGILLLSLLLVPVRWRVRRHGRHQRMAHRRATVCATQRGAGSLLPRRDFAATPGVGVERGPRGRGDRRGMVAWQCRGFGVARGAYEAPSTPRNRCSRLHTLLRVGAPLAIGTALMVTQSITNRAVAARLDTGDVAALGYADRLFLLPVGFVLAVVGPRYLGGLTTAAVTGSGDRLGRVALDQLRWLSSVLVASDSRVRCDSAAGGPNALRVRSLYRNFDHQHGCGCERPSRRRRGGLDAPRAYRVLQATARYRQLIRLTAIAAAVNLPVEYCGRCAPRDRWSRAGDPAYGRLGHCLRASRS